MIKYLYYITYMYSIKYYVIHSWCWRGCETEEGMIPPLPPSTKCSTFPPPRNYRTQNRSKL